MKRIIFRKTVVPQRIQQTTSMEASFSHIPKRIKNHIKHLFQMHSLMKLIHEDDRNITPIRPFERITLLKVI